MAPERRVPIRTGTIDLGNFLKLAQVVATGGEAKRVIQDGHVRVNGEVERRRGRQLHRGDHVDVAGETLVVDHTA